jgi:anti-anti-sigma factor
VASVVQEFKKELRSLIAEEPAEIAIDLTGVDMIDSVGLGVLIATHNSISKIGGKLTVMNASENIYGLLKTMRLDRHFGVMSA